jgi:hypothetical protein
VKAPTPLPSHAADQTPSRTESTIAKGSADRASRTPHAYFRGYLATFAGDPYGPKPVTPADVDSASLLNGDCDARRAGAQLVPKFASCCRFAAKIPSAGQDTGNCNGGHHDR